MTAQSIVLVLGGLLIVIGVIGGGFEAKEVKVPKIGGISRGLSLIAGIVLIGIGITIFEKPNGPPTAQNKIDIVAGTYGQNCGAPYANSTAHLESLCNGVPSCSYLVDHNTIGDPKPLCAKDYTAEWRCGNNQQVQRESAGREASGKVIKLACE